MRDAILTVLALLTADFAILAAGVGWQHRLEPPFWEELPCPAP